MVPRKNGPRKNGPRKNGPREKWSPENGPRKNGPRKIGPRKNVLQKLFSVKKMLGNLNDFFIFINWFDYTQKDVWRSRHDPTYAPNCRTLTESRKIYCRVLGFHRLITFHADTTMLDANPTIFRFWIPGDQFSGDHFSGIRPHRIWRMQYFPNIAKTCKCKNNIF